MTLNVGHFPHMSLFKIFKKSNKTNQYVLYTMACDAGVLPMCQCMLACCMLYARSCPRVCVLQSKTEWMRPCARVTVSVHRLHLSSTFVIPGYTWAFWAWGLLADCMCQTLDNYTDCCPRNSALTLLLGEEKKLMKLKVTEQYRKWENLSASCS